jgi:hypothetical protein
MPGSRACLRVWREGRAGFLKGRLSVNWFAAADISWVGSIVRFMFLGERRASIRTLAGAEPLLLRALAITEQCFKDTHAQDNIQRLKEKSALDGHARSPAAVGGQSVGTLA